MTIGGLFTLFHIVVEIVSEYKTKIVLEFNNKKKHQCFDAQLYL